MWPASTCSSASADSLPFVAESLLRDPERLAALRTAAYERLSGWIPFALPVAVLRAAIVELVGEPVPPDVSLGTPSSAGGSRAEPARHRRLVGAPSPADARDDDAPRVTVVAAIAGATSGEVEATLDSVAHGAMRDLELVIVGGAGTDPGDVAAGAWMQAHPGLAARLVPAGAGASLGAARNAGLAAARAPLCLLLDAGQALYPRGLGVLTDALDVDPGAAFAYPDPGGDRGARPLCRGRRRLPPELLGVGGAAARRGNYIHAPVLVRTDVLRAVGGFSADDALCGFEDYDLWCRIADRGGRGVLVPQVLARRPESGRSEVLAVDASHAGAPDPRACRARPGLLAGAFASPQ